MPVVVRSGVDERVRATVVVQWHGKRDVIDISEISKRKTDRDKRSVYCIV